MSIRAVLLPVFVEVALVFALLFWGAARGRGSNEGLEPSLGLRELALSLLFFVLTLFAWNTRFTDLLFLLLAWVFVVLGLLHVFGLWARNDLARRSAFSLSRAIVLAAMWAIYAARILLALG